MSINLVSAAFLAAFALPFAAQAECQADSPDYAWNIHSDDMRVSEKFLQELIGGKTVSYVSGGTEHYKSDGSYQYTLGPDTYDAPEYRLYSDGVRCIDYAQGPRFDLYVANHGKLVLVNGAGGRYEAKIK